MKHIPNTITSLRILMAAALFFIKPLGSVFLALYFLSGFSDILDGYLARKFGVQTELGAKLDAFADFLFIAALVINLWPIASPPVYIMVWFCAIAAVRLSSAAIGKVRFGSFTFLHTYANKATGFLLFFYTPSLYFGRSVVCMVILCAVATLSAAEELTISLTQKSFDADRRSIFVKENADALH